MTTREIYFKLVMLTELPMCRAGYIFRDKNNIIQVGKTINLELNIDKETIEKSIQAMNVVERMEGFMFWNISDEGEKFFKENLITIIDKFNKNL